MGRNPAQPTLTIERVHQGIMFAGVTDQHVLNTVISQTINLVGTKASGHPTNDQVKLCRDRRWWCDINIA